MPLFSLDQNRLAADVTSYAGREVELLFSTTSYEGKWLYFDDVAFSSAVVSEPYLALLVIGGLIIPGFTSALKRR